MDSGAFSNDTECTMAMAARPNHDQRYLCPPWSQGWPQSRNRQLGHRGLVDGWDLRGGHRQMYARHCLARLSTSPVISTRTHSLKTQTIVGIVRRQRRRLVRRDPTTVIARHGAAPDCPGLVRDLLRRVHPRPTTLSPLPPRCGYGRSRCRPTSRQPGRCRLCTVRPRPRQRHLRRGSTTGWHDWPSPTGFSLRRCHGAWPASAPGCLKIPLPGTTQQSRYRRVNIARHARQTDTTGSRRDSESDPLGTTALRCTDLRIRRGRSRARYGTALGATELDAESLRPPARRSVRAAAARGSQAQLAQIRECAPGGETRSSPP